MLRMEITVHDQLWPQITITVSRESFASGRITQQAKIQYDLSYNKLEEMMHNNGQRLVQELVGRHQRSNAGVPTGQ